VKHNGTHHQHWVGKKQEKKVKVKNRQRAKKAQRKTRKTHRK